jgi:gamma-glutamyltranspeptidase/glutathione hydrolase
MVFNLNRITDIGTLKRVCFAALLLIKYTIAATAGTAEIQDANKTNTEISHQYAPESASQTLQKNNVAHGKYSREVIATANPIATQSGWTILSRGGNAVDAAVCIQMVLTLVEPQSSGIGGGGFLVLGKSALNWKDKKKNQSSHQHRTDTISKLEDSIIVFDGRETAPSSATENLFLDASGIEVKPMDFKTAQLSSKSIGVPGVVAMLWKAHQKYGKLPWNAVIEPAIELAESGFPVSPRLHELLVLDKDLIKDKVARDYFFQPNLDPWPIGHILKNPELARVLKSIANEGANGLYLGKWAKSIVDTVNGDFDSKYMNLNDLAGYRSIVRSPLCFDFTSNQNLQAVIKKSEESHSYKICGAPPPSSGTLAMAQIFGMLIHTPGDQLPFGPDWLHYYTEASRLAFADRDQYVGDLELNDDTHSQANYKLWQSLISPEYLNLRAKLIEDSKMSTPKYGVPAELQASNIALLNAPMPDQPEHGTTHMSIVDRYGNSVAFTSTVESAFGAHKMVNANDGFKGGFLMNSELTDFSFLSHDSQGKPIINSVQAGKRPRSSMTPTLVFEIPSSNKTKSTTLGSQPNFKASLGSPGGAAIIHFTTQTLWAMLKWDLSPQEAINLPHFAIIKPTGNLYLEKDAFDDIWTQSLLGRQQTYVMTPLTSGIQAIEAVNKGFIAGADNRREGTVIGR